MEDHLAQEDKLAKVRDYLTSQFPDHAVTDTEDLPGDCQAFKIGLGNRVAHRTCIAVEFLEDHNVSEIEPVLRDRRLAEKLREAGKSWFRHRLQS